MCSCCRRYSAEIPFPFTYLLACRDTACRVRCACFCSSVSDTAAVSLLVVSGSIFTFPFLFVSAFCVRFICREVKWIYICTQITRRAPSFYSFSCLTLALEWSQTSLRQESAESLSTPSLTSAPMVVDFRLFVFTPQVRYIHPLPFGTPPVSGGESVTTENTAQADCPPETGATRSEATEGVDKSLNSHPLTVKELFSIYLVPTGRHFIDNCNYSPP